MLTGRLTSNEDWGATRGLDANDDKQGEDRGRSERNRLQKAQKELRNGHCGIMEAREGECEITVRVDLKGTSGEWSGAKRSMGC
jgi:hypothetical protein